MSEARITLEKLLRRGENARLRGSSEDVSLSMTSQAHAAEYIQLRALEAIERYHAQITLAERDAAVSVQRDRLAGDGSRLVRITVANLERLALHLGIQLTGEKAVAAALILAPWANRFPITQEILEIWQQGRKVRSFGSEAAADLADAASFVAMRTKDTGAEAVLRRESARHFGDSKRLEKLPHWLDVLVSGQLNASGLTKEEIWSAIGVRREPQPLLIAGSGFVQISGNPAPLPLIAPYLGVPPQAIAGFSLEARYVLTIENLATFHDALSVLAGSGGVVLYTGGMPSPAWRLAYTKLLSSLSTKVPVFHWGDIDQGGFRIAAVVAEAAISTGRKCHPWLMSPCDVPEELKKTACKVASGVLSSMKLSAERAGWHAVSAQLTDEPFSLEQEALDPEVPLLAS
ncbi:hypothetical protein SAMN05428989_1552 [Pseudoxanthomonas sp. GM95]|uniref:Wadjet anti-phage system protein JetD domain-containing protein n=1 Tax=Pseudoxanthomonas sp. GM95 TaxID=1881043 RepID=UPI0008BFD486|nr:Wadjet anti-phage system protein JetD domain-containing protein [Pseudoxanthomonas sp. GM95]SEL14869.1 hypothetical protein SAMN05428989_1552 [Pseudoxanthomonas sp. GM95]